MRRKRRLRRIFICVVIFMLAALAVPIIAVKTNIVNIAELADLAAARFNAFFGGPEKEADHNGRVTYEEGFSYESLSEEIKMRITGKTFPGEFPQGYHQISYDDLVYVKVRYYDFEGKLHDDGELIVHKDAAQDVTEIFYQLYLHEYPFTSIRLADDFDGSDKASMEANNTSAFNYRALDKDDDLSWHCFGLAVDINPLYNPYILKGTVYPQNAGAYVDRSKDFPGKIDREDLAYRLFTERGWKWGGAFSGSPDYQHFYKEDVIDDDLRQKKE